MDYSNEELWQRIRKTDTLFATFTERGGTWRNRAEKNPGLDVDVSKGVWKDFRSNEGGTLYRLAQSVGALPEQLGGQDKQLPTPAELWQQATRNDQVTKRYLSQHRKIPESNYEDLLHRFRLGKCWTSKPALIHSFHTVEKFEDAIAGKDSNPPRLQMILLDYSGNKASKKHRGKTGDLPVAFVMPPLSGNMKSTQSVVLEGLENALSIRTFFDDCWTLLATSKAGLKHLPVFLEKMESVTVLADHDFDKVNYHDRPTMPLPEKTGQAEAWRLAEKLRSKGIKADSKIPPEPGIDANDAQRAGALQAWIDSLVEIPERFQFFEDGSRKSQDKSKFKTEFMKSDWAEPEPLIPERTENLHPYPIDSLSPTIRQSVAEFISFTPVPDALAGSVALGVAALASQHHANVKIDSQNISPISIFFIIEQASGERKSTVSRAFLKPIFQWERDKREQFNHETDPEGKCPPRLIYEDSTKESLIMDLADGHRSVALWSDEAGYILGSSGMQENQAMGYLTFLNKAWHGDRYVHRRKQAKSAEVEGYRLSCMLMMQQSILSYLLNLGKKSGNGWAEDTGFVTRFLFASPPSLIGSRGYLEAPDQIPAIDTFCSRITDLLSATLPSGFDEIPQIKFSDAAKKMWIEEFNRAERLCSPGNEYAGFGGIVSKHAEHIARIAGVFNVFEDQDMIVNADTMYSAISLAQWHLNEAMRIINAGTLKPETNDALDLLSWLKKIIIDDSEPLTTGELLHIGPIRIRNKSRRDAALKVLESNHWLRIVPKGKKQTIQLNPMIPNDQP